MSDPNERGASTPESSASTDGHASLWIYRGVWARLVRWLRVPEDPPTLPAAPGQAPLTFRPAAGLLRYWKFAYRIALYVLAAIWIGAAVGLTLFVEELWVAAVVAAGTAVFVVVAALAHLAIHLRYDTMWYVLGDRSLRVRRGIWTIHETTITFENVQNVRVTQGPLQRYFGIADVRVDTAGGGAPVANAQGGAARTGHVGVIEGIADAPQIRDLILSRLNKSRTTGLGDEPHASMPLAGSPGASNVTGEHLAMLREIRDALRADAAG